ncbi:Gfo/Idh/MocA family protein [Ferruginibacter albus]|uniref:Gfo/Idh/MocA family protein n=1 Tax=Ferruginibacter albus TaxID=2875540 RepID=UPI001CC50A9C|nr:Gfo/Idh/MocA family oxidoreductase [Ferruginibacter albus]UAY53605.1 Gfo/Idh/MocA family oxidoreductase [Ferruginibacter albus]
MKQPFNIGVLGAGNFARFAVGEFIKTKNVKLHGVFDENMENAILLKQIQPTTKIYTSAKELLLDKNIDLIYIGTPPYLHYEQSKAALLNGKHVICEKPAALTAAHAFELKTIAEEKNLLYTVNLMQRYNPLYSAVDVLIKQKILGDFLHGFFENYACDEVLPPTHWFWDETKSGGIFIEHGVHFFDMFEGWLGKGKVIAAQKMNRKGYPTIWDKYQAIVQYPNGLVNFYHAFEQAKILDRQELRLQFERGEITLYEWVPTRLKMTAVCTEEELKSLKKIFPTADLVIIDRFSKVQQATARFKEISFAYKIQLDTGNKIQKYALYAQLVSSMFEDQLQWINDNTHIRKIDQYNAVCSVAIAEAANEIAVVINTEIPNNNLHYIS